MERRRKILITLFSALVLLATVTLAGCFGDEEKEEEISTDKDENGLVIPVR